MVYHCCWKNKACPCGSQSQKLVARRRERRQKHEVSRCQSKVNFQQERLSKAGEEAGEVIPEKGALDDLAR